MRWTHCSTSAVRPGRAAFPIPRAQQRRGRGVELDLQVLFQRIFTLPEQPETEQPETEQPETEQPDILNPIVLMGAFAGSGYEVCQRHISAQQTDDCHDDLDIDAHVSLRLICGDLGSAGAPAL
jgi:hypothetical protein